MAQGRQSIERKTGERWHSRGFQHHQSRRHHFEFALEFRSRCKWVERDGDGAKADRGQIRHHECSTIAADESHTIVSTDTECDEGSAQTGDLAPQGSVVGDPTTTHDRRSRVLVPIDDRREIHRVTSQTQKRHDACDEDASQKKRNGECGRWSHGRHATHSSDQERKATGTVTPPAPSDGAKRTLSPSPIPRC
jgi:hypothetical protein